MDMKARLFDLYEAIWLLPPLEQYASQQQATTVTNTQKAILQQRHYLALFYLFLQFFFSMFSFVSAFYFLSLFL